jgi:hypothetical protein
MELVSALRWCTVLVTVARTVLTAAAVVGLATQVAAVKMKPEAKAHVDFDGAAYPALQVGWHVAPAARELVQVPTAPLVGAAEASHAVTGAGVGAESGVGAAVGAADGVAVGVAVGAADGVAVGVAVGSSVGDAVGLPLGVAVGSAVGAGVVIVIVNLVWPPKGMTVPQASSVDPIPVPNKLQTIPAPAPPQLAEPQKYPSKQPGVVSQSCSQLDKVMSAVLKAFAALLQ